MAEVAVAAEVVARRHRDKLARELGPLAAYLREPGVVELLVNPDGAVWVERAGGALEPTGEHMRQSAVESLIGTIASLLDTAVTVDRPVLEGELPFDGSRVEALIPPVVSAPTIVIRRRAEMIFRLSDYVEREIMTRAHAERLHAAVVNRENVLVVGGTGSGKTTLLNAMLAEVAEYTPTHRVIMIEDVPELQCAAPDVVSLRTAHAMDMTALLRATMRLRPDRIVVGETRDQAALALLKAWNTGHPGGLSTVHANGPREGLTRLDSLIQEAGVPSQRPLIADAVNVVAFICRDAAAPAGRRLKSVCEVKREGDSFAVAPAEV